MYLYVAITKKNKNLHFTMQNTTFHFCWITTSLMLFSCLLKSSTSWCKSHMYYRWPWHQHGNEGQHHLLSVTKVNIWKYIFFVLFYVVFNMSYLSLRCFSDCFKDAADGREWVKVGLRRTYDVLVRPVDGFR